VLERANAQHSGDVQTRREEFCDFPWLHHRPLIRDQIEERRLRARHGHRPKHAAFARCSGEEASPEQIVDQRLAISGLAATSEQRLQGPTRLLVETVVTVILDIQKHTAVRGKAHMDGGWQKIAGHGTTSPLTLGIEQSASGPRSARSLLRAPE
jgi:hypothetical protein